MKELERTRQQLDPVGALPTRILAITLSAGAFVYGLGMPILTTDQISNSLLAVLALVCLGGASLTVGIASSPRRAPFTATTHTVVQALALCAVALSAASQWGSNRYVQDDFGPISLGMLIVAMGVYRPAKELAATGALAAIFVGFITLLTVSVMVTDAPPASLVLVGMAPVLALSFGSAAYSGRLVGELEKWQRRAAESFASATSQLTDGITKSVRQDRVRILDRDVFPFFNEILSRDTVTEEDRVRARRVSESIRALMVAEADRTWLEVVAGDDGVMLDDMHRSVVDEAGRATRMVTGQRTILRALIVALREETTFVPESLTVTISGTKVMNRGLLVANLHREAADPRDTFAPYFAVMRIVFTEVSADYQNNKLTVRFSYEQR